MFYAPFWDFCSSWSDETPKTLMIGKPNLYNDELAVTKLIDRFLATFVNPKIDFIKFKNCSYLALAVLSVMCIFDLSVIEAKQFLN